MKLFGSRLSTPALIGIALLVAIVGAGLLAPWIAPYGETDLVGDVWAPPSLAFPLGTDNLGRDMLSRLLFATRTTLTVVILSTIVAFALGVAIGFLSALIGGLIDQLISALVNVIMAVPVLIVALMVLAVLGTSVPVLILTMGILEATRVYRLARAVANGLIVQEFVRIAALRGEGWRWIVWREILPNAVPALVAEFGLRFCFIFLFVASLSFLGLGVQPPFADWGAMVHDNTAAINLGGLAPFYPAAAIAVTTIAVNLIVDWLLSVHARPAGIKE
ncbi:ABC transporter permease [Oryzibacter oryziterrae]|uniref:ABC transporter permease n=1 Tax=Oryzibacter oryziterrae TaxID=2766474 RepID=UPI001F322C43|nr:ABC transporter permease [Oryzibacter oryziterrae]